ncbi:MAG: N-acetyltransferase family protein [Prevotella sp.]|nr:N-acetyltransferase family protein [Prevotella sp.]
MIRDVAPQDIPQITAIYNYYVLHTVVSFETAAVSEEEMARRMLVARQRGCASVCVDEEDNVTGYCCVHPWKERAAYCRVCETTIYVHPDRLRQGIGRLLLAHLIDCCRQTDIHALIACITANNLPSIHLHEQFGFVRASLFREVGVKKGMLLDVVDYELIINSDK